MRRITDSRFSRGSRGSVVQAESAIVRVASRCAANSAGGSDFQPAARSVELAPSGQEHGTLRERTVSRDAVGEKDNSGSRSANSGWASAPRPTGDVYPQRIGCPLAETRDVLSAFLMFERFAKALKVAVRDEGFLPILGAALLLVIVGTLTYTLTQDWSLADASTSPSQR